MLGIPSLTDDVSDEKINDLLLNVRRVFMSCCVFIHLPSMHVNIHPSGTSYKMY